MAVSANRNMENTKYQHIDNTNIYMYNLYNLYKVSIGTLYRDLIEM